MVRYTLAILLNHLIAGYIIQIRIMNKVQGLLTKKKILFLFLLGLLVIYKYPRFSPVGKIDDWEYSPPTKIEAFLNRPLTASILGMILVLWLAIPIYLIVKAKPITDPEGNKKTTPKRFLGIYLIVGPLVFLALLIGTVILGIWVATSLSIILGVTIIVLFIWYLIRGIVYAVRYKAKIALISLFAPPVLLTVWISVRLLSSFFGMSITSGAITGPTALKSYQMGRIPGASVGGAPETSEIGFSAGGAKDINNFRENIKNNYFPLLTDITYEGLFYDYFFDTGEQKICEKLFCPSYSYAISKDPFSNKPEYYLSVGLNSGIKAADFQRKKLNLVIVLDISGSMSSPFNQYYYDQFGRKRTVEEQSEEDLKTTKMKVASQAIVGLLDHLDENDSLGMVLFDDQAYLAKRLRKVKLTDINAIKDHILELEPQGATWMSAGMKLGTELFDEYTDANQEEYENRIIFLTDAMPNLGMTSEDDLLAITRTNADHKIYTTFIGIGVDFNTELVEYITKIRGANYYSVHSAEEFKERMTDEFEYMVTPLVFNLSLALQSGGFRIDKVYGSPEANEATGELMKVNTLFPSKKVAGETKGGLVLLKLTKLADEAQLKLIASYEDRSGEKDSSSEEVILEEREADYYQNTGIRKGILLVRYTNLIKNWLIDERPEGEFEDNFKPRISPETGILIPELPELGRWERQSVTLRVSDHYQRLFADFLAYFQQEMESLGDESLDQEAQILKILSSPEV